MYHAMLKSVYKNEGFWIGRYEAGIEGTTETNQESLALGRTGLNHPTINVSSPRAICQKDAIPYNCLTVSQSEKLAEAMLPDKTKTSSLLFGIQWDLLCKFLEEKSDLEIADINSNSEKWGNYKNTHLDNLSTKAKGLAVKPDDNTKTWLPITTKLSNDENNQYDTYLSTGSSEQTKRLNMYDLAGNVWEATLEHYKHGTYPCVLRGGTAGSDPAGYPSSIKGDSQIDTNSVTFCFRVTLY